MQIGDVADKERRRGWWNDQYLYPHESTHTIGEVLRWFRLNNIEYYQTLPPLLFSRGENLEIAGVWNKKSAPNPLTNAITQLLWILKTHHEGGYWITFGRKR